jgi:hypothetical protein
MSETTLCADPRYRSLLVELLRITAGEMILSRDVPYMVQVGDWPVRQVSSPLGFLDLLGALEQLYVADPANRSAALAHLSEAVTNFVQQAALGKLIPPLQIDLVVSASELSALPFELACNEVGAWLVAREDVDIELTRRVRLPFAHRAPRWHAKPRILFVSASPPGAGKPVPQEENKRALRNALFPWIEPLAGVPEAMPDETNVLMLLPNASLPAITAACEKAAAAKKPFTHIHVLAHGMVVGRGVRERYGLALHNGDGSLTTAEPADLVAALKPVTEDCSVVTLAVCHGGAENNPIYSWSSLAHRLHAAGIPVVIGSQFPLTFPGSAIFAEQFYSAALCGEDVRAALHVSRLALKAQSLQTNCDWAALVGYVRLPEGYSEHLIDVALEADLASLRTTQSWFDHIIAQKLPGIEPLREVARRIEARIGHLIRRLREAEACGRKGVLEENLGLLGSAEKRLAEVQFKLWQIEGTQADRVAEMQALQRSLAYYRRSFRQNLSHHWTGVQMLSLEAAVNGRIEPKYWYAAVAAAETALENEAEYWAAGSLLELQLLAAFAGGPVSSEAAKQQARSLAERVPADPEAGAQVPFPIESTLRQLRRYVSWWTKANGFFPNPASELGPLAAELSEALQDAWKDVRVKHRLDL